MTKRRGLLWHVFPAFALVVTVTVAVTAWYASRTHHEIAALATGRGLRACAAMLAVQAAPHLATPDPEALRGLVAAAAREVPFRLTIIRRDGTVLADSEDDPARMESHADRPEFASAVRDGYGESSRYSSTVRRQMLYCALAVRRGGQVRAVCRAAAPLTAIDDTAASRSRRSLAAAFLSVLAGALVSLWLSRRLARTLAGMQVAADRMAQGDLQARVQMPASRELAGLATSLNTMAAQLAGRIEVITRQKEEVEAIFAGMAEGVLAIDAEARIIHLNQAAARILGQDRETMTGRNLREVLRNPGLYEILDRTFRSATPVEGDVFLHEMGGTETYLQVCGSRLPTPAAADQIGAILVLNNVTRLKRLENLRREFAANVSHELRTPVTSIKGFVETLLDGALDDRADAERFLKIVRDHAGRLEALIQDLLALAGLERQTEAGGIVLTRQPLAPVLAEAVASRDGKARAKQITVRLDCPADLEAELNPGLFQQAVGNLLDNAIAYSEPATAVNVAVTRVASELRIAVSDQGRGIPAEHLDRIFERFYRIDKARSRDAGGTGLGLAIVKHVAQAHKGRIEVQSCVGTGSTFTLVLPAP